MTSTTSNSSSPTQIEDPQHWIFRIADGDHFWASSQNNIWGINSKHNTKKFLRDVKTGDILWFLKNKQSGGNLVACATYQRHNERILGPLLQLTKSNEELGWTQTPGEWDTEVHYSNLYDITELDLIPNLLGAQTIRRYNEKCEIKLDDEYPLIVRYSKVRAN